MRTNKRIKTTPVQHLSDEQIGELITVQVIPRRPDSSLDFGRMQKYVGYLQYFVETPDGIVLGFDGYKAELLKGELLKPGYAIEYYHHDVTYE